MDLQPKARERHRENEFTKAGFRCIGPALPLYLQTLTTDCSDNTDGMGQEAASLSVKSVVIHSATLSTVSLLAE